MKIKQVLESDTTETEQEQMHSKDENTTWFGIIRERGEMPLFQDYGRYAQIMSDITSRDAHGAQETRYPGMVSFVGQTGMVCNADSLITINRYRGWQEHTYQARHRPQHPFGKFCYPYCWLRQKSRCTHIRRCTSIC
jgi:hypothetical protein